jgi:hypothetical protein
MANAWRKLPKWMSWLAMNPKEPEGLEPYIMKCSCGSAVFFVINEKRPFKHKTREANRKRHRAACVLCGGGAEIFTA